MAKIENIDLNAAISVLVGKFPAIDSVYIFGSRRYKTDSIRSDIDLLVTTSARIKHSDLRDHTIENCTALDIFLLEGSTATSIANDSYISADSQEELIAKLNAVKLFNRDTGRTKELDTYKTMPLDRRVNLKLSSLPNTPNDAYEIQALIKYFESADRKGLPTKPYIGQSANEASDMIITVMKNLISANENVTGHGQAKGGWANNLLDEYDFQNLFWITIKPWLSGLGREEVELTYDGNKKISDFNLFNNQIIIELKHVKNDTDKRNIVKTLSGLKDFYKQHPNIRVLIFGILVDKAVQLDDKKWESDFSYLENDTHVKTIIIRNTK
ncbi:hypothetical protein QQ020_23365 [Fulvivirgaceae bacterium BMA12]|uniref:Polymerase beta nucleotidyltransferase domain-containing protein n=1 Tax=Agaribacillus aureus TaxID=3051825 RepID=A0ABT8LB95_9BACT|nr:hypothetical protein [Fulvivirgaceae bacterium BMA12]